LHSLALLARQSAPSAPAQQSSFAAQPAWLPSSQRAGGPASTSARASGVLASSVSASRAPASVAPSAVRPSGSPAASFAGPASSSGPASAAASDEPPPSRERSGVGKSTAS